ncbi:hypothetical protein WM16_02795 [Burkholderia ubonensis]|uniref:DUF4175 domain-containing protein n=1 Tax=Burkholderia ubonensis TaxID=101571 RepID=A0A108D1I9_9BURK|nr:hypothetical protein [Burkholderia ubonensis]KWK84683.1 hypothetical protein WM16_02795 [Burkholderia ubonensis]
MASNGKRIWFPAKRYGWGWDLPVTWQGWVALLLYMLGVAASAWLLPPHDAPFAFGSCVAVLSAALVVVCWLKGEKPKWRWGDND